jgi:predicted MFS family arabinose efflux permease
MLLVRRLASAYRAAFSGLAREVWLLALGAFVNRAGTMVLPFLSLYLTSRLGMSAVEAGRVLALYGVGSVLGSSLGGWLSDRLGAVRVQLLSLATTGFAFLVLGQTRGAWQVSLAVFFAATVADAFRPAMMVAIAHYSTAASRIRSFALIRLAANAGMAIGPAVGGLLAVHHYRWLFVGDAATCWAAGMLLALALGLPRSPVRRADIAGSHAGGDRSPFSDLPFLAFLVLIFLLASAFFQIWSTLPLDLRTTHRLSEPIIGGLLALSALLVVCFEMLLLRAIEHLEQLRVVGAGAALVGLGLGVLAFGGGLGTALIATLVWTLGEMLALPMSNAVVASRAPLRRTGAYMGAYTVAFSLAFVAAPVIGTAVFSRWGGTVLWPAIAVLGVLLGVGFSLLSKPLRASRR